MAFYHVIFVVVVVLITIIQTTLSKHEEIIVALGDLGSVKGIKIKSSPSNLGVSDYNAFYGIPYAQPPLGGLRFRPPKILEKFNENENVFDATDPIGTSNAMCPQMSCIGGRQLSLNLFGFSLLCILNVSSM